MPEPTYVWRNASHAWRQTMERAMLRKGRTREKFLCSIAALLLSGSWPLPALAAQFVLCVQEQTGNVRAVPVGNDCSGLAGNWTILEFEDGDWSGAGTGALRPTHLGDDVVIGAQSGTNSRLTVNAGPGQEAFRARADGTTALFVGQSGRTGVRNAAPQSALHIGSIANEDPLRVHRFGVNQPELIVNSTGNVGVGEPNPSDKLSVRNSAAGRAGLFSTDNPNNIAAALAATTVGRGSAIFANVLNPQSTSSAVHGIHSGRGAAGEFEGQVSITRDNHQLLIRDTQDSKTWSMTSHQDSSGIGFWENGPAGTGRFLIRSGGNVGIGTTDPITKLHVQGSNDGTDLLIRDTLFARARMVATNPGNDVTLTVQARGSAGVERAEIGTVSNHNLVLFANGSTRIVVESGGGVCIGNC